MLSSEKKWPEKLLHSRLLRWGIGIPLAMVLILYGASFFLDEPLRRFTEKKINNSLKGYSVRLSGAHFQLIGLTYTLKGLTVFQQAHPDPPVVSFPVITAAVHWREIILGRLVAEVTLDQPKVNINLLQLRSEASSSVQLKERGWQQALEQIYPLKINTVTVKDASVTYIDQDPQKPLVLSRLNLQAANIRNIRQAGIAYPSPFHLDTAIFGTGHGTVDGDANFLTEPHPGINARFKIEKIPIDYFNSVIARSNLSMRGGVLGAFGNVEYASKVKVAHLEKLTIQGMNLEYIHSKSTASAEKKRAVIVGKAVKKLSNKPGLLLRADQVNLTGCTIGMVNNAAAKPYRIFFTETDFQMNNFSNQLTQGPAEAKMHAKLMGSGITTASATFRPDKNGPDFDLNIKVKNTRLTSLNNVLRTYGDFDVSAGFFSLVSEIHVKNGKISGYIKPFFKDLDVYGGRKDEGQKPMHQAYEMMIGGVAQILENRSQQEVATRAVISGSVSDPETSTWQIIGSLLKNAFFTAILPKFDTFLTGAGKR